METNSIALQRIHLKNLEPAFTNVLVIGIIISKQKPKRFVDQNNTGARAVWNFTLRDSRKDYINVTYWGTSDLIFQMNDKFKTGDIIEIVNPEIVIRKINDYGEQFHPMVTSPFKLSLSDKSNIVMHEIGGHEAHYFYSLLRCPTKPIAGFVAIKDIHNSGASLKDTYVDILGALRGLGQVRTVTTRANEVVQVREIEVFDHTSPSLKIQIWEPDIISRSDSWKSRTTILFFTDLKVNWSNFERAFTAKVTGRTIVTENPDSQEAGQLLSFAKNAPIETFDIVEQLVTSLPDPNTIQDVMSIKQVQDKINLFIQNTQPGGNKQFTALLFSFVSQLDLDGLSRTLIIKCGKCKMLMRSMRCENSECSVVFQNEYAEPDVTFDIRVMLSDHTGTLTNCRLRGQAAETTLNCTARKFSNMTDDQKCTLKWRFLMESCSIRIAVFFIRKQSPIITILSIEKTNKVEVARLLPVY